MTQNAFAGFSGLGGRITLIFCTQVRGDGAQLFGPQAPPLGQYLKFRSVPGNKDLSQMHEECLSAFRISAEAAQVLVFESTPAHGDAEQKKPNLEPSQPFLSVSGPKAFWHRSRVLMTQNAFAGFSRLGGRIPLTFRA